MIWSTCVTVPSQSPQVLLFFILVVGTYTIIIQHKFHLPVRKTSTFGTSACMQRRCLWRSPVRHFLSKADALRPPAFLRGSC